MAKEHRVFEGTLGQDKITLEVGKVAGQADGAVVARYGDTIVLATCVVSAVKRPDVDFFPMSVDFEERWYASGKISGSRFIKREGRPSENAILTGRLIDRPLRPLFPKGFRNDLQIIVTVLSVDLEHDPDILAIIAASAACTISGAPFEGPIAAVRIGLADDKLVVNPRIPDYEKSKLDLVVAGTAEAITMVEAGAHEVDEADMLKALELAHSSLQEIIALQSRMKEEIGAPAVEYEVELPSEELKKKIKDFAADKLGERIRHPETKARHDAVKLLEDEVVAKFFDEENPDPSDTMIRDAFGKVIDEELRRAILEENVRPDGRKLDEIRTITIESGLLPRVHGSALFTRGETQALTTTTLAGPGAAQLVETMDEDYPRRYMHHYIFPPYSVGEVKRLGGLNRREIGHGALAERAIIPMLPSKDDFPYTIRVVSEIMSSNGSTSMASVCGSTLSLMDAGVQLKKPVAGIAMGLMTDGAGNFKILSDIRGVEDFAGDMDFKVAGTDAGITALQMDMKVKGISVAVMGEALSQAKAGRLHILEKMVEHLPAPRSELSKFAPRIVSIKIDPSKIKNVIGKGGETINTIVAETGVEIDIDDEGLVSISSVSAEGMDKAVEWVKKLTWMPEAGEIEAGKVYKARVTGVKDELGAFVEFLPGKEGLVHISQIADHRVGKTSDELAVGDMVDVKLLEIDSQGRANLSIKEAKK